MAPSRNIDARTTVDLKAIVVLLSLSESHSPIKPIRVDSLFKRAIARRSAFSTVRQVAISVGWVAAGPPRRRRDASVAPEDRVLLLRSRPAAYTRN
jgi:hypothetical protein